MAKYRYIGALPATIEGRLYQPDDVVELSDEFTVQTVDVCPDEPLFEAVTTTKKAATKAEEKE